MIPSADEQAHGDTIQEAGPEPVAHVTNLDVVLASRRSPRRRVVTALLVGAALLIAVGLVLRGLLPTPSAPALPPPTVAVVSNLSFGTISINGHRLAGASPATLLRDGNNTLALDAPPFQAPPCTVRWPLTNAPQTPRPSECPILRNPTDGLASQADILLFANSYDLLPAVRESAFGAVALSYANIRLPVVTVPAGDYIAAGMDGQGRILSQRAPTTLIATPSLAPALATDPAPGPQFSELVGTCAQLVCPSTLPAPPADGGQHWNTGSAVTLLWHFTDAAGKLVASARYALPFIVNLTLTYAGSGDWLVTKNPLSLGRPLAALASACDLGTDELRMIPGYQTARIGETQTAGAQDEQGCVLQTANPQGGIAGTFIWRFGVLLAGDLQAHLLVPWLPVAPQDEVAAVQT